MEHVQQQADILEMQPGGRLVEDVQGAAGVALGELARQLDALRLATGQRGRGLAEMQVAEADVVQQFELVGNAPRALKKSSPSATVRSSTSAMFLPL